MKKIKNCDKNYDFGVLLFYVRFPYLDEYTVSNNNNHKERLKYKMFTTLNLVLSGHR